MSKKASKKSPRKGRPEKKESQSESGKKSGSKGKQQVAAKPIKKSLTLAKGAVGVEERKAEMEGEQELEMRLTCGNSQGILRMWCAPPP